MQHGEQSREQQPRRRDGGGLSEKRCKGDDIGRGEGGPEEERSGFSFVVNIVMLVGSTVFAIAAAFLMHKFKGFSWPVEKPTTVSTSILIQSDILSVYDYISTPEFRTEWHMGSVEVSGPAIDHSAVVGERFVEEMSIGSIIAEVEWNVVDREIPSSISTSRSLFVIEGAASMSGGNAPSKQTWVETVRIQSVGGGGKSKGPRQVNVELELILECGSKKDKDCKERTKKMSKRVKKSMKESLLMMRMRVESGEP